MACALFSLIGDIPIVDGTERSAVKEALDAAGVEQGGAPTHARGLIFPLRRVPVACMKFEPAIPEFPSHVQTSWQAKFDVGSNSYVLIIDKCRAEAWMAGDLFDRWPHVSDVTTFHMVKFDNVVNRLLGTTYDPTPRNDSYRERLTDEGLAELFSRVITGIETFGAQHDVRLFVACAYRGSLERLYRYLLTRVDVAGYVSGEFTPANEQAHFAFARRQG